jgi:hypothetical protein
MCLYQKFYHFKTTFWANYFFCLLDHAYTQNVYLTCLKYNINTQVYKYTPNMFETS